MGLTADPGDVVLVARLKGAAWVSRAIQRYTRSWYSHAMIALGDGRYAHAIPAPGGSVALFSNETELGRFIGDGPVLDLFRPHVAPDPKRLEDVVDDFCNRAGTPAVGRDSPCGLISELPDVVFSDGNLLALGLLKFFEDHPKLRGVDFLARLRDAVLVAAEDGDGRLLCSGFVHRALDLAGARPESPPPGQAFLDLSDFPTDELTTLGPSYLYDWLLHKLWQTLDFDPLALRTCEEVVRVIVCHFERRTPIPTPLHVANFTTPGDLGLSPSLRKIASRWRLPNRLDSGWIEPLDLTNLGPGP